MKRVIFVVMMAMLACPTFAGAKEKKSEATPVAASIPFVGDELKDAEILLLRSQLLEAQIEKLQTQVMQARQKSNQEIQEFKVRVAKAHGVDPAGFNADLAKKELVPVPPPAVEKK